MANSKSNIDWIIHFVFDQPGPFPYLANYHTHDMENYRHLNFQVVLAFPYEHACYLLNEMGLRVQAGKTFQDGDLVSGLYEDCDVRLKKVRETGRYVLRLVIPDKNNRFPDEPDCMEPYKYQELPMFEER